MTKTSKGPLAGIRVLDIGTMIAGPVAATLLGDFGAEVIKVEQPGGDPLRNVGPFIGEDGLWWNVEGRGKKSVTLNLRTVEGQEILRSLASQADVLIENFRPGTLKRWNIDYGVLGEINPKLVMLSVSGFGQTGPYAERAAYDRIALAFAGMVHITGYPERPPLRPGVAMADYQSALFGAYAVMMALFHRDARGGNGQHIDLALYEAVFRFSDMLVPAYTSLGIVRERRGNLNFAAAPGDHFPLGDGGYLVLTVSSDSMFRKLCDVIGRPELAEDPKFQHHEGRWANITEINGIVGDWILSKAPDEVAEALRAGGLASSRVYSIKDIAEDPHYAARESIATVENSRTGPIRMPAPTPRLSGTPAPPLRQAPALGENNGEILGKLLSIPQERLDALRAAGVI